MAETAATNSPEITVTELAGALKKTVEERFGYVRVRGEISNYRGPHSSGHVYFSLKDQGARIDAVIWKGSFARMRFKPEEGMEVIAAGKITTYPGKSAYQIVIDTMEPAGVGALMALLEARRLKLNSEGLFEAARKQLPPFLPTVIGVVTSPTGAVIRDILHRLSDRFPVHVLVWPVRVQGETSAAEVAGAIEGFNALAESGPIPRPDVIIVARGGGSLEDLWSFNEEIVVRAAAESFIPLISAVGHETDWTLIDHAADVRAPTPTAAAELSVPVRAELLARLADIDARRRGAILRFASRVRSELRAAARALASGEALLAGPRQRLDRASSALGAALSAAVSKRSLGLGRLAQRLARRSPQALLASALGHFRSAARSFASAARIDRERRSQALTRAKARLAATLAVRQRNDAQRRARLREIDGRLARSVAAGVAQRRARVAALSQFLGAVSYRNVLKRGFALVRDSAGAPLRAAASIAPGAALRIEFADGEIGATAGSEGAGRGSRPARAETPPKPAKARPSGGQGSLF